MKRRRHISRFSLLVLGWLTILPGMVSRAESRDVLKAPHVEVRLHLSQSTVAPGQEFEAALEFVPESGWHTYWKNAGDLGFGPRLEWVLPEGSRAGPPLFETPERVSSSGKYINFGYERPSLVGTEIHLSESARPGETAQIQVSARWLVCRDVCVPGRGILTAPVRVAEAGTLGTAVALPEPIRRARTRRPAAWPEGWELKLTSGGAGARTWILSLIAQGSVPLPERSETFEYFPAQKGLLKTSSKLIPVAGLRNDIRIRRDFQVEPEAEAVLPGLVAGVLKVGAQSWERSSTEMAVVGSQTVAAIPGTRGGEIDFLTALPAAFLGGLLLNLMPCVFPVLWLKVLSFLQAAGRGRRRRLQDAMGYALGIVGSFLALAGVLLALRSGGQALGWGFQLQAPGFVLLVAALFFLISLNLLGVFEIGAEASGWLANRFSKSRAGRSTRSDPTDESFLSSMGTGVLAVIVATPCTAPFMGSALGFALTGPLVLGLLVFAALGLGLAFPYIILAVWPGLGRLLPRPGRWMETFKQALAFPMLATVAWLLWVLSLQRGSGGVLISLGVCLILALAAWGLRLQQRRPQARGRAVLGFLLVILLIVGGAANALQKMRAPAAKSPTESAESVKEGWLVWSPEAEALARRQGAVFIDFTAAWCVTCQVNEAAALDRPRVREAFRERGVRLMKADWTGEDPRITRALAAYGRTGVPLYVLIPFNGTPILLPQILSPAILLKELERIPRVN